MTLFLQSFFTAIILFIIYLFLGPARFVEADAINEFLYLFLIPLYLIIPTIACCLLIGLPVRLIPAVNKWWKSRQLLPIIFFLIGIVILALTLQPDFAEPIANIITRQKFSFNLNQDWIYITAWFIVTFSLLHFYPKSIFKHK